MNLLKKNPKKKEKIFPFIGLCRITDRGDNKKQIFKDWRLRSNAINAIEDALKSTENLARIQPYLESLLRTLFTSEKNLNVLEDKRRIIMNLIVRLPLENLEKQTSQILNGLCRQGGAGSNRIIKTLIQRLPPTAIVLKLLSDDFLQARSSKFRENALQMVLYSLMTFPSTYFDIVRCVQYATQAALDSRKRVRQAALDVLAVLGQISSIKNVLDIVMDIVGNREDVELIMAAIKARLSRKQLPIVGVDGTIQYALRIPSPQNDSLNIFGADIEWICAGIGSVSPTSIKRRSQQKQQQNSTNMNNRHESTKLQQNYPQNYRMSMDELNTKQQPQMYSKQRKPPHEILAAGVGVPPHLYEFNHDISNNNNYYYNNDNNNNNDIDNNNNNNNNNNRRISNNERRQQMEEEWIVKENNKIHSNRQFSDDDKNTHFVIAIPTQSSPILNGLATTVAASNVNKFTNTKPLNHSKLQSLSTPELCKIDSINNTFNSVSNQRPPPTNITSSTANIIDKQQSKLPITSRFPAMEIKTEATGQPIIMDKYNDNNFGYNNNNNYNRSLPKNLHKTNIPIRNNNNNNNGYANYSQGSRSHQSSMEELNRPSTYPTLHSADDYHHQPHDNPQQMNGQKRFINVDKYLQTKSNNGDHSKIPTSNNQYNLQNGYVNNHNQKNMNSYKQNGDEQFHERSTSSSATSAGRRPASIYHNKNININRNSITTLSKNDIQSDTTTTNDDDDEDDDDEDEDKNESDSSIPTRILSGKYNEDYYNQQQRPHSIGTEKLRVISGNERDLNDRTGERVSSTPIESIRSRTHSVSTIKSQTSKTVSTISLTEPIELIDNDNAIEQNELDDEMKPIEDIITKKIDEIEEILVANQKHDENYNIDDDDDDLTEVKSHHSNSNLDESINEIIENTSDKFDDNSVCDNKNIVNNTMDNNNNNNDIVEVIMPDDDQQNDDNNNRNVVEGQPDVVVEVTAAEDEEIHNHISDEGTDETDDNTIINENDVLKNENHLMENIDQMPLKRYESPTKPKRVKSIQLRRNKVAPLLKKQLSQQKLNNGESVTRQRSTTTSVYSMTNERFDRPKDATVCCLQQLEHINWEETVTGLQIFCRLIHHHPEHIELQLHNFCVALGKQIKNLRSQVSRAACQATTEFFVTHTKSLENEADDLATILLNRTADTNKFLRSDATISLETMCDHLPVQKCINILAQRGATHQNALVRTTTAKLLARIVERCGVNRIFNGLSRECRDRIFILSGNFLMEGSLDTRNYAKAILQHLASHQHYNRILLEVIPSKTYRNIEKTLKSIR